MEGPKQQMVYLGILIDAAAQIIMLPEVKLVKLKSTLLMWSEKSVCTKRELLSLIGSLSFASKVLRPGRIFLRRLIDLSTSVKSLEDVNQVSPEAQLDIAWWGEFLPAWNGRESFLPKVITGAELRLYTDASDVGMGGVMGNKWFWAKWGKKFTEKHINVKELFAVATAIFIWARGWKDKNVVIFTDNKPITQVWM